MNSSHAVTVVPECYKDDVESQWKSLKLNPRHPKTPEPMATKRQGWLRIYPCAKLHNDPITGFCSPHMRSCLLNVHSASFLKLFFLFFWVLPTRYRLGRCADFEDQYVKRRRFAQGCAFWGSREQIFTFLHFDSIFGQKREFLVNFRRRGKFRLKTGYNMGTSSVNTP